MYTQPRLYVCVCPERCICNEQISQIYCVFACKGNCVFCSMNEWMSEWTNNLTNRQAAFSKPPPIWNQQTPTGPHQPCLTSRKSEALKPQEGNLLRRQIQYTRRLQTVVRLSLQGPAPPRSRQGGAIQPPLLSLLPGAQNLVYAQPRAMAQKKTIRDIITEWRMTLVKWWQLTT